MIDLFPSPNGFSHEICFRGGLICQNLIILKSQYALPFDVVCCRLLQTIFQTIRFSWSIFHPSMPYGCPFLHNWTQARHFCEAQGKGRARGRPRKVNQRSFIDCRLLIIVYTFPDVVYFPWCFTLNLVATFLPSTASLLIFRIKPSMDQVR